MLSNPSIRCLAFVMVMFCSGVSGQTNEILAASILDILKNGYGLDSNQVDDNTSEQEIIDEYGFFVVEQDFNQDGRLDILVTRGDFMKDRGYPGSKIYYFDDEGTVQSIFTDFDQTGSSFLAVHDGSVGYANYSGSGGEGVAAITIYDDKWQKTTKSIDYAEKQGSKAEDYISDAFSGIVLQKPDWKEWKWSELKKIIDNEQNYEISKANRVNPRRDVSEKSSYVSEKKLITDNKISSKPPSTKVILGMSIFALMIIFSIVSILTKVRKTRN